MDSAEKTKWWQKKTWWGTVVGGLLGAATVYMNDPTPMGILKAATVLATAWGLLGASEIARSKAASSLTIAKKK